MIFSETYDVAQQRLQVSFSVEINDNTTSVSNSNIGVSVLSLPPGADLHINMQYLNIINQRAEDFLDKLSDMHPHVSFPHAEWRK